MRALVPEGEVTLVVGVQRLAHARAVIAGRRFALFTRGLAVGQAQPAQLQGAGHAVPKVTRQRAAELRGELRLELAPQEETIEDHGHDQHPESEQDGALHREGLEEAENDEDQCGDHQELADVPPCVHELADVAPVRALVPEGEVTLVVGVQRLAHARAVIAGRRFALFTRGLAVIGHQGALPRGLLHAPLGGGCPLAGNAGAAARRRTRTVKSYLGRWGVFLSSKHLLRIPATPGRSAPVLPVPGCVGLPV